MGGTRLDVFFFLSYFSLKGNCEDSNGPSVFSGQLPPFWRSRILLSRRRRNRRATLSGSQEEALPSPSGTTVISPLSVGPESPLSPRCRPGLAYLFPPSIGCGRRFDFYSAKPSSPPEKALSGGHEAWGIIGLFETSPNTTILSFTPARGVLDEK